MNRSEQPTLAPGAVVDGRYRVLRALGRGGLGSVFAVHDRVFGREVALKALRFDSLDAGDVFRREFALLCACAHPRLARPLDFTRAAASPRGLGYYTSELVRGVALDEHLRGRTLADALPVLGDALDALGWLHGAGIVHGDFKPDNVLVREDGSAVLIDLSAARRDPTARGARRRGAEPEETLPDEPEVSGTARFLAPELFDGALPSARSDLFAVGRTLEDVLPLLAGTPPPEMARLVRRLLSPEPADRPAGVAEVLDLLRAAAPTPRRDGARGGSAQLTRARPAATEPAEVLGRDAEMEAFAAALDAAVSGRAGARVVAIHGPEGIGKSRLLRELKWRAQLRVPVVEAWAREPEPVRAVLSRALGRHVAPGVDAILAARDELARGGAPLVVALDDADQIEPTQQALLEAMVRSAAPADTLLWLLASAEPFAARGDAPRSGHAVLSLALGPLDEAAVRAWTAPLVTAARVPDLVRASGGQPRALKELCAALASGAVGEADLHRFSPAAAPTPTIERAPGARPRALLAGDRAAALATGAAHALAALALADRLDPDLERALGVQRSALEALEASGLARLEDAGWRLGQPGRARSLLTELEPGIVRDVARALAQQLSAPGPGEGAPDGRRPEREAGGDTLARDAATAPAARSERSAERVRALVHAGEHEQARAALLEHEPAFEWAPPAWARAADAACDASPDPATLVAAAAALEAAGDPRRALGLLARARRARPAPDIEAATSFRAARCYEKLGRVAKARRQLERARATPPVSTLDELRRASLSALCSLRLGRYREAAAEAARALDAPALLGPEAHLRGVAAELAETQGLALGFLGDSTGALRSLSRAVELRASGSPRARVRTSSYHALQAYRAGDLALAVRGFQQATDVAEAEGLGDLLATAALNLGTAKHQLGDWGAALRCYERGLRAAIAFGKERTEATLRFNLAKIHADIGLLDRAEVELAALRGSVAATDAREVGLAALGLAAEVAVARGRLDEAADLLEQVRAAHAARGSKREVCEAALHSAEVALAAGRHATAAERLGEARALLDATEAADLGLRHATASAELCLTTDDADGALEHVQRGAELGGKVSKVELLSRHEEVSSEVFRRRSATALAERHRRAAREGWERIAATLPAGLVDTFWRHARRGALRAAPEERQPSVSSARMELMRKLLEVNRRLSSTLDTDEVLGLAMDSAIEVTGAERGFVILASPGGGKGRLEVAVARNLDRERVGKSQLKFSHGIAKRVVEQGEAVLTVDALADDRFSGNTSVHALRLRSIVCVPIRAHGVVLGALYLDNRFQRGRFAPDDADLLGAFADQVAVALHNGRLMSELRDRTRALEEEQRRVAELMHSQTHEIERLSHELERERSRVEARRDFPDIVGRSAPMRSVLALVDRVSESDVPVTVTGESGTGKELVARAIHSEGPRRDGPFVAVNCAALPEALLESELFGHVKGAFTGAVRDHGGLFVAARGGTLFLDEIGETPLSVQAKLLRALQEREVRPVGSDRVVAVPDVRIVCATNRDLQVEVARGRFREDLYYRISVIEIRLPALRDRPEDIPALAQAIVEKLATRQGRAPWRLSHGALRRLSAHAWPGNVRQLENVLARACVLASGDEVGGADLELPAAAIPAAAARSRQDYRKAEEDRIRSALEASRWNVCEVSRALGIPRTTLYRKLAAFGLLRDE